MAVECEGEGWVHERMSLDYSNPLNIDDLQCASRLFRPPLFIYFINDFPYLATVQQIRKKSLRMKKLYIFFIHLLIRIDYFTYSEILSDCHV
jgi:hypothetical protein